MAAPSAAAEVAAFLQARDLEKAEAAARALLAQASLEPQSHLILARVLLGTERLEEALEAARKAASLAPALADARLQVILTLLEMGRPEEALSEAESFAVAQPADPEALALAGLVLRRVGRLSEAVATLDRVAEAHPGHLGARLWLAHALHDLERHDRAGAFYLGLIRQAPQLEEAHWGLANTLADAGRLAEAAQAYAQAARSIPGFNQRWPDLLLPRDDLARPVVPSRKPEAGGLSMVLAFVPFELPSVPLGLATLKAYVEATTPHRITAVDLNARFFQAARAALREGRTPFHLSDTAAFLAAADFLSEESDAFFDPALYERHALAFERDATAIKSVFTLQCERIRQVHGPVPWHARAMARALTASAPRVVGLSAMFDSQLPAVHVLAHAVRLVAPETVIVLGGGAFSAQGIEPLLASHAVDYVVLQDGEETLAALLTALAKGEEPERAGLCHRHEDGHFAISDEALPIKQDKIPPADFSDYDLAAYFNPRPVLPLLTSRGCYWRRCTFCNHFASYAGTYKAQAVDRVVAEMAHHGQAYGVRHFSLVDEMISAARFRKIAEEILAHGLDVTYYALAKPTADFTPEILEVMYRSGCRYILWGQESGSERMLAIMDKGNTVASSDATLQASATAGLRNHLFLMVGYPTEEMEDLEDTVRFLARNHGAVDQTQSGPFVLEKGTPLYARPADFGIARILDRRVYGGCQLVRFEVARGLTPGQAEVAERTLKRGFFAGFNPFSRMLGDFRDHALIIYSRLPRPTARPARPDPDRAMAEVRAALTSV